MVGWWGDEVRGGGRVLIRYGVCVFSTKRSREGREKLCRKEIKGAEQTRGIHKIYKMPISRLRFRSTLLDCKGARCSCEKIKSSGREGKGRERSSLANLLCPELLNSSFFAESSLCENYSAPGGVS